MRPATFLATLALLGCSTKKSEPPGEPTGSAVRVDTSCSESATFVVINHENELYRPATDPSERMAQGGAYAQAAIASCADEGWSAATRACLRDAGTKGNMKGVDRCLLQLAPAARMKLGEAFARVETSLGSPPPPRTFPWLAP